MEPAHHDSVSRETSFKGGCPTATYHDGIQQSPANDRDPPGGMANEPSGACRKPNSPQTTADGHRAAANGFQRPYGVLGPAYCLVEATRAFRCFSLMSNPARLEYVHPECV